MVKYYLDEFNTLKISPFGGLSHIPLIRVFHHILPSQGLSEFGFLIECSRTTQLMPLLLFSSLLSAFPIVHLLSNGPLREGIAYTAFGPS